MRLRQIQIVYQISDAFGLIGNICDARGENGSVRIFSFTAFQIGEDFGKLFKKIQVGLKFVLPPGIPIWLALKAAFRTFGFDLGLRIE